MFEEVEKYPKITIVIPVRNEEKFLVRTVQYLLNQQYPPDKMEIIIIAGDSVDKTDEIAKTLVESDSRVRFFKNPKGLASAGRNIGVENATGEIITFVDGHTYIDNDNLLNSIVELMSYNKVSVLSRPQFMDTPENSFFQKAVSLARKSTIGHGLDSTIYTDEDKFVDPSSSGATYKKELFDKIGAYDERFDACEDVEFNYRVAKAGYKSYTSMRLAVYYYPRDSMSSLFQQLKRYGIGRFRLFKKHPGTLSPGTLAPLFITIGLPLLLILSIFLNFLFKPFLGILGLYIIALLFSSAKTAIFNGPRYFFISLPIYLIIHLGLGYGFFSEFLKSFIGKGVEFG